jgi:hypothetical protein
VKQILLKIAWYSPVLAITVLSDELNHSLIGDILEAKEDQ